MANLMAMVVYFIIFVFIEFFEALWQKESSLNKVLIKNYLFYKQKGIFLFLALNMSFFYAIFLAFLLNNFLFWINVVIVMKFLDISFKLYIFQKIDNNGIDILSSFLPIDVSMQGLSYINLVIYSSAMFFAIFLS